MKSPKCAAKLFPPAEFFAQGGCTLSTRMIEAAQLSQSLPSASEKHAPRLIHLQCATGEDTLSWAGLGVEAYGVDISDIQV